MDLWESTDPYAKHFRKEVDTCAPGIWQHLEKLDALPDDTACRVAAVVLNFACQAANDLPIRIGQEAFKRIPKDWLAAHLPRLVAMTLDVNDSGDYWALMAMLGTDIPELTCYYVKVGLQSSDPDVVELAQRYAREYRERYG